MAAIMHQVATTLLTHGFGRLPLIDGNVHVTRMLSVDCKRSKFQLWARPSEALPS